MTAQRPVAWHVGRQGEVAGGMTQVVNGYLSWPFEFFELRVIRSRDGSRGPRAWWLFLRACLAVLTLSEPRRNIVIVHLSQGGSFLREGLLLWLARRRGFGTVAHLHGSSFVAFAQRRPGLVRWVLSAATRVLVLSEATRAAVSKLVPACRVQLVPNAVPPGAERPKEKLVVFGGGVTRRKGVDVLVDAWRQVGGNRGWQLVVAGPVVDADVVPESLPDALFPGATPHAELMALLERSSIAVLPSRDEAMPMFILEAMARSNCVISTAVGSISWVVREGRGVGLPAGDSAALAAALRRAMDDAAWRAAVAQTGRVAFDGEFSAKAVYPRVEEIWRKVLAHPAPQGEPSKLQRGT